MVGQRESKDLLHLVWECWIRPGKAHKHRFHNEKWRQILVVIDNFIFMNRDHATKELQNRTMLFAGVMCKEVQ